MLRIGYGEIRNNVRNQRETQTRICASPHADDGRSEPARSVVIARDR